MNLLNHLGSLEIRMKNSVSVAFTARAPPFTPPLLRAIFISPNRVHTYYVHVMCHRIALLLLVAVDAIVTLVVVVIVAVDVHTIKPTDRTRCDRTHLLSSM